MNETIAWLEIFPTELNKIEIVEWKLRNECYPIDPTPEEIKEVQSKSGYQHQEERLKRMFLEEALRQASQRLSTENTLLRCDKITHEEWTIERVHCERIISTLKCMLRRPADEPLYAEISDDWEERTKNRVNAIIDHWEHWYFDSPAAENPGFQMMLHSEWIEKGPWFVIECEPTGVYGGPEEGGWWYDNPQHRRWTPAASYEHAEQIRDLMVKRHKEWRDENGVHIRSRRRTYVIRPTVTDRQFQRPIYH
tara:strand:- start:15 stop:767 length:753 start_codon:yes stop_codon:yes gene_type:complete